jgi:hypothetical protein
VLRGLRSPPPPFPLSFSLTTTTILPLNLGAQFLISLSNFCPTTREEKMKFAFDAFDEARNGVITKEELVRVLKANHLAATEKEVVKKAETILAQADSDGDGVVSFDEFVVVAKRFPNILFASALYGNAK